MTAELRSQVAGETRTITAPVTFDRIEARDDGKLRIGGYAAVYDSESEDLGFRESLAPNCFRSALAKPGADPFMLFGHDRNAVLARQSAGTLTLAEDGKGLRVDATMVPTTLGRDTHLLVRSGHVRSMSFAFTVKRDEWSRKGGEDHRRVLEVGDLFEVSLVPEPAYSATSASARAAERELELAEVRARVTRTRPVYGEGSEHSYFRDLLLATEASKRERGAMMSPRLQGRDPGSPHIPGPTTPSVSEARGRLKTIEKRALSTTPGAGGQFSPANMPPALADAFAVSAGAVSVLPQVLTVEPIEIEAGMVARIPAFTTGASVGVMATEGAAVSNTDPGTTQASGPIATLSGYVDMSRQELELSNPKADRALSAALGKALGAQFDLEVLTGSGTGGHTLGLLSVTGTTATTYTDATPTVAEYLSKLGSCWASTSTALGQPATSILVHPRRWAWLISQSDASGQPVEPALLQGQPAPVTQVPAMPVTAGGGTEDPAIVISPSAVHLYANPPAVKIFENPGSANAEVRVLVYQYLSVVAPRPEALGKMAGSGCSSPVFA